MLIRSCALLAAAALAGCAQPLPRASMPAPATAPMNGPAVTFQCGTTAVQTQFGENTMSLTLDGRTLVLPQAIAASGARYAGLGPDGPVEFWNKGRQATLTVGPRAYPECQEAAGARR
ncbi:MliC family protein [Verticiella alkaliphila]|uniref:MliC family protein n=1 Tax=Verticiella alkaliphila TaxID=2779529 RepID=UPI001C0C3927|nr:MliC family protein [Verticiella sp. GG226]